MSSCACNNVILLVPLFVINYKVFKITCDQLMIANFVIYYLIKKQDLSVKVFHAIIAIIAFINECIGYVWSEVWFVQLFFRVFLAQNLMLSSRTRRLVRLILYNEHYLFVIYSNRYQFCLKHHVLIFVPETLHSHRPHTRGGG